MNYWTDLSIQFASQRNYLDELFTVYPLAPDSIRELDKTVWNSVEAAFNKRDNTDLIKSLLRLKLFPIKDSYVSFLRRDKSAIERNPETVNRICSRLYELGLDKIYLRSEEPKEANCQVPESLHTKIRVNKGESVTDVPQRTDWESNSPDSHEAALDGKS